MASFQPRQDPTFQTGAYVFGYSMPGYSAFGNARTYSQQAIFGTRAFGGEIPGKNCEDDILMFIDGPPVPRATGPWGRAPLMSIRARGAKAKRFVFRIWRNRRQVARYTPDMSAPKDYLVPWADKLAAAMAIWRDLSPATKRRLQIDAVRLKKSKMGHNFFVQMYIKNDTRWMDYV